MSTGGRTDGPITTVPFDLTSVDNQSNITGTPYTVYGADIFFISTVCNMHRNTANAKKQI